MEPITGAVAGLAVSAAAGWIARGLFGGDTRRAIEGAKERMERKRLGQFDSATR